MSAKRQSGDAENAKLLPRPRARVPTNYDSCAQSLGDGQLDGELVLPLCFVCGDTRTGGQLQHGRTLTFAQLRQQNDLPIGKLERIMMDVGLVHVDLPELSHLVPELTLWAKCTAGLALHFILEGELRTGKQAYGHVPVFDRSETTRS